MPLRKEGRASFRTFDCGQAPSAIENIFKDGGKLSAKFPGYKPRDGQISMMRQVWYSICNREHSAIEAPCGTGKSLAYLVPAAVWALSQLKTLDKATLEDTPPTIVVVTANIALQEQLINKDLPLVADLISSMGEFKYKVLKGRNNYLCHAQLAVPELLYKDDIPKYLQDQMNQVRKWGNSTLDGDRSKLPFEPDHRVWSRFSMTTEDCPRSMCDYYSDCHAFRAQRSASVANIIVTNYHLLVTSLTTDNLLPSHENTIYILDEAHELPDIARELGGGSITALQCISLFNLAADCGVLTKHQAEANIGGVYSLLSELQKYESGMIKAALPPLFYEMIATIESISSNAMDLHEELTKDGIASGDRTKVAFLASLVNKASKIIKVRDMTEDKSGDYVTSLSGSNQIDTIKCQLVEPAKFLRANMFDRITSVICTSATLTTGNKSFSYFMRESGLPDSAILDTLPSPFYFKKQSLLITPRTKATDPNTPEFKDEMSSVFVEAVKCSNGRALGLFTSYDNMKRARDKLESEGLPYRILSQGTAPRDMLIKEFREDVNSVLLGSTSLWTGVDVSGEALSLVFIDKLPFPQMNDPVIQALQKIYDDWFERFSLPSAIMALRQGFGRLIRSVNDKGVVVLCDPRIVTKGYGKTFVSSLPDCTRSYEIGDICSFLKTTRLSGLYENIEESPF
jgi:ATP-dependent DNA helicase DinG